MKQSEGFRDELSTIGKDGKRVWVYPKKIAGKYFNFRQIFSYSLLAFLFLAPHIKMKGNPILLFNLLERKFIVFGKIFWPQDFYLFALSMIGAVIFVSLFTVVFGRLFCGWACPQTIFMEMVFRRIEYAIEGDWTKQKKLNKGKWDGTKIFKKVLKHSIFWLISFLIANTFLAYIIGADKLIEIQFDNPMNHLGGLTTIIVFSTVFYGVFAFLREQVCTTICPYGRLQGVLLDSKSINVAYDYKRGEGEKGRAKFRKNEDRAELGKGDCIDCKQCVHVCPTGIDIRNGTQLECVNCTACMDACDFIMESVGLEKGLIGYISEEGIETGEKGIQWNTRVFAYSGVLALILSVLVYLTITRSNYDFVITRLQGTTFNRIDKQNYSNSYNLILLNKTKDVGEISLKILEGKATIPPMTFVLEPEVETHKNFALMMSKVDYKESGNNPKIIIGIYKNGELVAKEKTLFMGPSF